MSTGSRIQWTDATWNPTVGCKIVSPGCANCYAMKLAGRLERMGGKAGEKYAGLTAPSKAGPVWAGAIRLDPHALMTPLKWRKPRRIFVNSMSDLFHEDLPDKAIDQVFAVMALCPQHTFQVLTKRARRMREYLNVLTLNRICATAYHLFREWQPHAQSTRRVPMLFGRTIDWWRAFGIEDARRFGWPLPHIWLGVSVEDQAHADERVPDLLQTPAAVHFLSCEPLLGPVDLMRFGMRFDAKGRVTTTRDNGTSFSDGLKIDQGQMRPTWCKAMRKGGNPRIDWVIVGGESGPRARPMHPDWARWLRDQCAGAAVPFFFKQWGEFGPNVCGVNDAYPYERLGKRGAGRILDGIEHNEFPRAREAVEAML